MIFFESVILALDRLEPDAWLVVFRESTSPKFVLAGLSFVVLDRGMGPVGQIHNPNFMWHVVALGDVISISQRSLHDIKPISHEGLVMAHALVCDGILKKCPLGLPPKG